MKCVKLNKEPESLKNELDGGDSSDEEELQQAFDMHSLIISSLQQEPMFTAEDVINEIEGMMEDDETPTSECSMPSCSDDITPTQSAELIQFKQKRALNPENYQESLRELSLSGLNELLEELEAYIKDYSETLIQELALRDELEYEKELKNTFISLLLSIQKKRRESQMDKKKINNNKRKGANDSNTYLTTVIPYHANQGTPSSHQLQVYIKILKAINEDSAAVPGLLTDYILKVLCPT
ncbi:unnamed protein product [Owenia fusiformis]|uniref:Fasciculation and elongation protein zeta-2 n=1 Tax=Owenia fusiformis TaxID=6347 RepID=A0A8S4PDV7_OWEFU|nr:unnamed protein product [Owenia fusiformis]